MKFALPLLPISPIPSLSLHSLFFLLKKVIEYDFWMIQIANNIFWTNFFWNWNLTFIETEMEVQQSKTGGRARHKEKRKNRES